MEMKPEYNHGQYNTYHVKLYSGQVGNNPEAMLQALSRHSRRFIKMPIERFLPFLPIRFVLRYHLRSDKWIPKVLCPVYILHGTRDWLIPIRHSERLQKLNPRKITLIRIHGGGHNNLPKFPEYHNFIRDILKY